MISKTLLVIIGVAIAVGVGLLIYYLTKKDDKKSDTMTTFPPKLGYTDKDLYKYTSIMNKNLERATMLKGIAKTSAVTVKDKIKELKIAWDNAHPNDKFNIIDHLNNPNGLLAVSFSGTISGTTLTVEITSGVVTGDLKVGHRIKGSGISDGTYISSIINDTVEPFTYTINKSYTISTAVAMTALDIPVNTLKILVDANREAVDTLKTLVSSSVDVANKLKTKNPKLVEPADQNIKNLNKTLPSLLGDCSQNNCDLCIFCDVGDCSVCDSCGCTDTLCCPPTNPPGCGWDGVAMCLGIEVLSEGVGGVCSAAAGSTGAFEALFDSLCVTAVAATGGVDAPEVTAVCTAVLTWVAEEGVGTLCSQVASGQFEQMMYNDMGCTCDY